MTKRIWVGITLILLVAFAVAGVFLTLSLTPKQVTITYDDIPGVTVKLVRVGSATDLNDLSGGKIVGSEIKSRIVSGDILTLDKGAYVISVDGENVEKKFYPLEVTDDVNKNIDIVYSQAYLTALLNQEEPTILSSLKAALPTYDSTHSIRSSKLYRKGDWYAARLRYTGPDQSNRDELKVVMKKTNNSWELVTKTPEIVVTYPKYPSIPRDVVDDINSDEEVKIVPVDQQSE